MSDRTLEILLVCVVCIVSWYFIFREIYEVTFG